MKRAHRLVITYGLLTVIGIVMVYPLLWMISASFKTNREIFSSLSLMPTEILWDGYSKGWQSSGQYTFATYSFFIFMLVQFIRGIPRELDEAARIDGCGPWGTLVNIILPLCKPALVSCVIFQFVWRWNDFLNPLIYISSVKKYPLSLALRMALDVTDTVSWNQTMAMSVLAMVPPVALFFLCQKYFVEGVASTGLKG